MASQIRANILCSAEVMGIARLIHLHLNGEDLTEQLEKLLHTQSRKKQEGVTVEQMLTALTTDSVQTTRRVYANLYGSKPRT